MTVIELVQVALLKNTEAFGNIHENRAEKIVRAVLDELGEQIKSTHEGEIEVVGFGKFDVRQVKGEKDGQGKVWRRVVFRTGSQGKKLSKDNISS